MKTLATIILYFIFTFIALIGYGLSALCFTLIFGPETYNNASPHMQVLMCLLCAILGITFLHLVISIIGRFLFK